MLRQRGFTILEVLVGFLVAALLLSVILSSFASGMRGLVQADRYSQAALVAQSRLAGVGVTSPLVQGRFEGRDDAGYAWRVEVAPLNWDYADQLLSGGSILYRVEVRVSWLSAGRENSFMLSSLRTGRRE